MSRATQVRNRVNQTSLTGLLPSMVTLSQSVQFIVMIPRLPPYNPKEQALWFGLFRFRSPLLTESSFLYIPPGTEMFHFPGFAPYILCIQMQVPILQIGGLPHSDISGSQFVCNSPELFAACHVLHRLLMPRHPPYALNSLTIVIFISPHTT